MVKEINKFEGLYTINTNGEIYSIRKNRNLKPNKSREYPRIKLSEKQVIEIYKSNKKYSEIMYEFNVSIGTVSMIKNKKIWKHIL